MILTEYYLYGFNNYCRALLPRQLRNAPPLAIIDKNAPQETFLGVPVLKPDSLSVDKGKPVLNCLLGYQGVEDELKKLGFQHVVHTFDVFKLLDKSLYDLSIDGLNYRVKPLEQQINTEKLSLLYDILQDNESRATLNRLIAYRRSPSQETYVFPESYEMYFPPNIANLYDYEQLRVIDVGAFDGDTLKAFVSKFPNGITNYACIEVNNDNIKTLQASIQHLGIEASTTIFEGAVGLPDNVNLVLRGESSDTRVLAVKNEEIQVSDKVVTNLNFSALLFEQMPNIIKMDIEGADFSAINEGGEYISKHLPTLALSIYHHPDDLWKIPLFIYDIGKDNYHYYIRHEGHWGFETIFYAVPKK